MKRETPEQSGSRINDNHVSPETSDQGWRSTALRADEALRAGADRVRRRIRERVAPHVSSAENKLPEPVKQAARNRSVQVGAGIAAAGVIGLAITGLTSGGNDQHEVAQAAVAAEMPGPIAGSVQTPPQQDSSSQAPQQDGGSQADPEAPVGPPVEGIDVSNHNGDIDWGKVAADGKKFTFILASDGTNFSNPRYGEQYHGAKDAGLIAGAYHFARPDDSSGAAQANRFLDIADYKNDGKTLPPVLDLEVDPSGGSCYGMSVDQMHNWTNEFNATVKQRTGKDVIVYANPSFWKQCMGGTDTFNHHALWLASYEVDSPTVPKGFNDWDFWQHTDKGKVNGIGGNTDLNQYKEGMERLKQLAH